MRGLNTNTIRKELEQWLEVYSVEEIIVDCRQKLKVLKADPDNCRWSIRYYEKLWILLSEY